MEYTNLRCELEHLQVYNGPYANSPIVDRVCDNGHQNYSSEINQEYILIEYYSSNYNPNTTFKINIDSTYDICGGILRAPYHTFISPLNGTQYPNNMECEWTLVANMGYHIGLEFVDRFFIEDSPNCTKDYIQISNKINNHQWELLDNVCGRHVPKTFNSTGTQLKIVFHSDDYIVGDGFSVRWSENCGGIFTASKTKQILTSPMYPENYPKNSYCNYTIVTSEPESFINLNFLEFHLEDTSRQCVYDNLTIYKYEEYPFPDIQALVGAYCLQDSLKILRYKRKINLILHSDAWLEKSGFKLEYYIDSCGGNITNNTLISSPLNPLTNSYSHMLECLWNITAPANQKIVIRFETFDVEPNDYCYMGAVEIYQGYTIDLIDRKAQLCGDLNNHLPAITLESNKAIVKYKSDYSTSAKRGFSALILMMEACDKNITLTTTNWSYTLDKMSTGYAEHIDCHYKVTAPDGYVIVAKFNEFHLAPCTASNTSCECDFIEIRDGGGTFAEQIGGKLCGHNLPGDVITSQSALWLRFATGNLKAVH